MTISNFDLAGLTKEAIRCRMLRRLKSQKEVERVRKSRIIENAVIATEAFRKAKVIVCYIAFGGEVETGLIMRYAYKLGKRLGVPRCLAGRKMEVCLWYPGTPLTKGIYGTWEPVKKKCIRIQDIDLVLVPGLAFDLLGNRLGRGKGFYDQFLSRVPFSAKTIGLAYDFQLVPRLCVTPNDFRLDRVIFA